MYGASGVKFLLNISVEEEPRAHSLGHSCTTQAGCIAKVWDRNSLLCARCGWNQSGGYVFFHIYIYITTINGRRDGMDMPPSMQEASLSGAKHHCVMRGARPGQFFLSGDRNAVGSRINHAWIRRHP